MTTSTDLRPLKKWLQRGEMTELCTEVGICRSQGANVVSGKSKNWMFVEKFLERVEKNKGLHQRAQAL
jgi:hypothetical protein